jgi:DNA-binding response OmpR family regulator
MRILVVEDERIIANTIKEGLEQDGYAVDVAYDGEDGYNTASADEYDVIISDVMMPEMDGFAMVKKLREDGNKTPILMLTAKSQEADVVKGLDTGADDYLAKPFAFNVLSARVRALLRRPRSAVGEVLEYADVSLDPAGKQVRRAGKLVQLSAKEFAILEYFMRNPERILSKNNILTHVWDFDSDVLPNNVESFIKLLRNKIDRPFKKPLIQTVRGFGYKLSEDE